MQWIKSIFKSGGSFHITIPKDWLNAQEVKFGVAPDKVTISENDGGLMVKAVKPDKNKGK